MDNSTQLTKQNAAQQETREKLHALLKSFDVVVLVTHALPGDGQNGSPNARTGNADDVEVTSRPMHVARLDDNCDLWFLSDSESAKIYEIRSKPVVHIVAAEGRDKFVGLRGTAHVIQDKAVIRELFSEPYKVWFPDGPETPGIRAIHVQASEAEFWDNSGTNKLKYLFQSAKAYVTGTTPETDKGDQFGRVQL